MRRMLVGLICLSVAGSVLVAMPGEAVGPAEVLSSDYVDRVNGALRRTDDQWGEKLLKTPDGPTYESLESLLPPAYKANEFLTDSAFAYLPQTYPIPEPNQWSMNRPFSLHVIDGSQLITNWAEQDAHLNPRRHATFLLNGEEIYGSRTAALATPALSGGHLPILFNGYTDASGTRWERESFVSRVDGALVSWVRFTAYGAGSTSLRVRLRGNGVSTTSASGNRLTAGGQTYLMWSAPAASWTQPTLTIPVTAQPGGTSVYLMVPNTPAGIGGTAATQAAYDAARAGITAYWNNQLGLGAQVEIPEEYASQAMRNLLIQNLVMGWQQSVGNGYEFKQESASHLAFVPEVSASVQVLGEFGQAAAWRKHLQEILRRGQGDFFPAWEFGIKMQSAASYYFLTNDKSYLQANLGTFNNYLTILAGQRANNQYGLVAKARYGSDIDTRVYGLHHQTEAWRGMRDLGIALRLAGLGADAARFTNEANSFQNSLRTAITASQTWLPDGSLYIPISLRDPNPQRPYDLAAATKEGSYWNLTIGYFAATGFFPPGSAEAKGLAKYLYKHGALFLGLTRFNLSGIEPGVCWVGPDHFGVDAPGYKSSGVDEQYGYSRIKFLSDNQEADRLTLNLYGKLAHDLTPKTFIGGEGTTVQPCPEINEFYRTQFYPPLSANNATYLQALRSTLVRESLAADGTPTELWLSPATPRRWLADGKRIAVSGFPTKFGPVTYEIRSRLGQLSIDATVTPPARAAGRAVAQSVKLTLRTPAGHRLSSVTVNGASHPFSGDTIDLGPLTATASVHAAYEQLAVPRNDQAEVTLTTPQRAIFQPGQRVTFTATVETLGSSTVPGTLSLTPPAGWTAPAPKTFSVVSNGRLAWTKVPIDLTVPAGTADGEYTVGFVATPTAGTVSSTPVKVRVARPVAESYSDLIKGDGATAYWRLGETTGTFANSSPYKVTATAREQVQLGQPGAIAGDANGSVRLNGGFLETPHALSVSPTGPSAMELWVKVTQGYQQGLLEKYTAPGRNGFALRLEKLNRVKLYLLGPNGAVSTLEGTRTLLPGDWHHIAFGYDNGWMDIYVDGKVEIRAPITGQPTLGVSPLRIGARGDDAAFRLNGWVDEVAMYPHPLTVSQVEEHFLKGVLGNRS